MSITQILGGKHQLTKGDDVITFSPMTLSMEAEFERRLLTKTKKSLAVMRDMITADEFAALVKSINDGYTLGEYRLLGKNGLQSKSVDVMLIAASLVTGLPEAKVWHYVTTDKDFAETLALVLKESIGELTSVK